MRSIALLTDFGTRDPYVAAMKGVIASRTSAAIHDLSHDVAPYDVLGAAWFVASVVRYWPAGTIFVCVIDPGVGTERHILAREHGGKILLAPDNGLLTFLDGPAHAVTNEALFLPDGSTTFHGRDRFAPVAAALANGKRIDELGPRLESVVTLPYQRPTYERELVRGTIVALDRFGNAITDVEVAKIPFAPFALRVREHTIERMERNYGSAAPGAFLIAGSTGCIEISVANASAAERLQLRRLERVALSPV